MSYIGQKPAEQILSSADIADGAITTAKLASSSVTQPKVNSGVAGTGPAFSAYQSSAQTPASNTWTKIQFQTEEFDTNNNFDSTTNYRFTPTVAGYYQVSGNVYSSALNLVACCVYKNGSDFKFGPHTNSTAFPYGMGTSSLVYLNGTTDYIEFYAYLSSSTALIATSSKTYFQASLVRAA